MTSGPGHSGHWWRSAPTGSACSCAAAALPVELAATDRLAPLPPGIDISAYRIVQEALTNSLKHGAAQARVELRRERAALIVDVVDHGLSPCARDRAGTPLSGGQGLI